MNTSTRRRAALGAALSLLVTLGACGDEKADQSDLASLTVMVPLLDRAAPSPDGEVHKAIEKFVGKKLDITWVPNSNYGDRTSVTLASDDVPEVMVVQGKIPAFVQSAQAGAFWDLTDHLGKYPNLTAENKQVLRNSSINGRNYGIFRSRDPMRAAVIVRKDWLAKVGLPMPETVDDLYRLATAFTKNDPDGNGKADTYGLIIPKWPGVYATASPYDVIETWFGAPNGWGERAGKLVPGFDTPEFLAANRFVKKLVDEKLINPDFATMDSGKWNDPFFTGKGGIIVDVSSRSGEILRLFKQKDASSYGNYVAVTGNLTGPDGQRHSYPTIGYNGFLAISKQSVPTEDELKDVLTALDKLSSKEGQILLNNGFENRNFTVQDGFAVTPASEDPPIKLINNDVVAFAQFGTSSNGNRFYQPLPAGAPERQLYDQRVAFHKKDLATAVYNPAQPLISKTYVEKGAQLDQLIADARIKYLAGQLDEEGLKAEIRRWYREGGQQIVDEMSELYAKIK
jgi:putative aldouronate transport system substrate-binding protein